MEILTRAIANEYRDRALLLPSNGLQDIVQSDRAAGGEYHKWLSYPGLCENRRSESGKGGRRT